jgi:CBS domain-containing protein
MNKHVHTVDDSTSVTDATKIIARHDRYEGYIIVLHRGQPVGIVSERNIVQKVVAQDRDPSATPVSDIMTAPLHTIDPDEDLAKVAQMMREHDVRKLVVAKDSIIHGIITSKDISNQFQDYINQSVRDLLRWSTSFNI